MTRVLLVCPEPLGHGQPAGIGIRFIEMARVLAADGHAITVLSRDGGAVDGATATTLTPRSIAEATQRNDMAVVQGHAANELFAHGRSLPTVVDLYDPFIVENLHYFAERGAEVFHHDHATVMTSIARGDFFLCASDAQRLFYLGFMLAAGRLNPASFQQDPHFDALIRVAPFGVQPARPMLRSGAHDLLFGGIYDWYDPLIAIDAVAIARHAVPDISLTFSTHANPDLTPQGKAGEAMEYVRKRGYGAFIRFEPWVAYDRRGEFFDRFTLSLLTFRQSIETDLSMRTRVFDYLWGGLPIVTSSAHGTDEVLRRYAAGSVIRNDSADTFATEIVSLLRDEQRLDSMRAGAKRFAEDHQWPRVLEPLREFCRHPHFAADKESFAARLQVPGSSPSLLERLKRRIGGAA